MSNECRALAGSAACRVEPGGGTNARKIAAAVVVAACRASDTAVVARLACGVPALGVPALGVPSPTPRVAAHPVADSVRQITAARMAARSPRLMPFGRSGTLRGFAALEAAGGFRIGLAVWNRALRKGETAAKRTQGGKP